MTVNVTSARKAMTLAVLDGDSFRPTPGATRVVAWIACGRHQAVAGCIEVVVVTAAPRSDVA